MSNENLELIIDSQNTYDGNKNVFHLSPEKVHLIKCLDDGRFNQCTVLNTHVDKISPLFLAQLMNKVVVGGNVYIVVNQPISVMQEYDAKQVEANARLAGYVDIKIVNEEVQEKDYKYNTLAVTFNKPNKVLVKKETYNVEKTVSVHDKKVSPSKRY